MPNFADPDADFTNLIFFNYIFWLSFVLVQEGYKILANENAWHVIKVHIANKSTKQ